MINMDIDKLTVGEFLYQVFTSWWELQDEMGRVKTAKISRNGDIIQMECAVGQFTPKERSAFGELIPLGAKKACFTQNIQETDTLEIDGETYQPLLVSDLPWGQITEYIVALVPEQQGGGQ